MTRSDQTSQKKEAELKRLEVMGRKMGDRLVSTRDSAFARYPLVFVLLTSFGLVATFYGFEKVIDGIPFFGEHPYMILVTGVAVLIGTGALYKKLN